jgi:DNA integrity scanning protein DisA with diadenylate cyclase activity
MTGIQIERMMTMIDVSLELTRDEVLRYVTENQDQIVDELVRDGEAWVPTSAGKVRIPLSAVADAGV